MTGPSVFAGTAAATERVAGLDATWRELLFDGAGALGDPDEPSQALLAVTEGLYGGLREHLATLPERARRHWLEETLGIPALPMLPDEVVAVATADAAAVPAVLARGTELRAKKAGGVPERGYVTTDALTVLGASLAGVHGYVFDGDDDRAAEWTDRAEPFEPFAGQAAEHRIDIVTDAVAFGEGDAIVVVRFVGVDATALRDARWEHSTATGLKGAGSATASGETVRLTLSGGCAPCDLDGDDVTYLRVSVAGDRMTPALYAMAFSRVEVHLVRAGLTPDGAYYNDGAVDVTKEFKPFGPVPRRGDSFFVRSDEAFGKGLESVTITITELAATGSATGGTRTATYHSTVEHAVGEVVDKALDEVRRRAEEAAQEVVWREEAAPVPVAGGREIRGPAPTLSWQQRTRTGWVPFASGGSGLGESVTSRTIASYDPASAAIEVAGTRGHYVRLYLGGGDFGWDAYLARIARFAEEAASSGADPTGSDLIPPEPPVATSITIGYTSRAVTVADVRTRNEPAVRRLPQTGIKRPFSRAVQSRGAARAGAVTFGFEVGKEHLGSALSWYAHVEQAPACGSAGRTHAAVWEYWTDESAWAALDTLDGTRGLRQSGLVRLVTPRDWADGCDDVGAETGRWLRLRTTTPDFVGDLLGVHADAVTARYRPDRPDAADDLAPLTPLVPGQLKGLLTPVAGVKVTNPVAGTPGRAAEDADHYRTRAGSVVRHRGRGIQAWDYETLVTSEFPEVAVVRCLPHTGADGCAERGSVGLVVLPRSTERTPSPSVALADRIANALRGRVPVHARVTVLCPEYVLVRFRAEVLLRRDVAAAEARVRILAAVERHLHPLAQGAEGAPFGLSLYPSSLVAFLEGLADVDHVSSFALLQPNTTGDVVPVDPCRGLIASGGDHVLALREQL